MPGELEIRPAHQNDHEAVRRVCGAAFGDRPELIVELVDRLATTGKVALSLVAELDGAVVGHVQLNHSWVDARPALVDVLVLSPLSVDPAHQGRGIGTALVAAAVAAARETGTPAVFLEGSPAYYGPRGFEPGLDHGFLRPSVRIPEPAFQVVVLESREDWMAGQLVYPEAFWEHDCTGLRDPELAELEQRFS